MSTRPTPIRDIIETADIWHACLDEGWPAQTLRGQPGALGETSRRLALVGNSAATIRLDTAVALGVEVREWRLVDPEWAAAQIRRYQRSEPNYAAALASKQRRRQRTAGAVPPTPAGVGGSDGSRLVSPPTAPSPPDPNPEIIAGAVTTALRRGPLTIDALAEKLGVNQLTAALAVQIAHDKGSSLHYRSGLWHLDAAPALGHQRAGDIPELVTDSDGVIRFAAVGDTHLGSKYAREDCLGDFYDRVEKRGIQVVLHAGNWIDGEAVFNRHDLLVHGMDAQMQYLAKNYPRRAGVETWAIAGADHEGWYSRREGVDIGRYAENVMRQNGRTDWRDMGYMECFISLTHATTGQNSKLLLMHPGGGSAYAVSYAPQKIVEGFDGGDKPSVLLLGHYHKASYNLIRNVHTVQTGCFQDQTVFMRQQKIAGHLAGCFIELRLDPDTGAVVEFTTTFRNYFVRDYYRNRWSQHGPVNHAPRSAP